LLVFQTLKYALMRNSKERDPEIPLGGIYHVYFRCNYKKTIVPSQIFGVFQTLM
jgi:hypothetical protein